MRPRLRPKGTSLHRVYTDDKQPAALLLVSRIRPVQTCQRTWRWFMSGLSWKEPPHASPRGSPYQILRYNVITRQLVPDEEGKSFSQRAPRTLIAEFTLKDSWDGTMTICVANRGIAEMLQRRTKWIAGGIWFRRFWQLYYKWGLCRFRTARWSMIAW